MKKSISVLALLAIIATGAFAQGISLAAGGGALFDISVGSGYSAATKGYSGTFSLQNISFGGFGFFDATYAELDVSFAYGMLTLANVENNGKKETYDASAIQLGFSLLGKYPIGMGGFTVFPLLGADYNMMLSLKDNKGNPQKDPGDWSQLGLLAGAGLDYPLSGALFLRAEALFHLRLASKFVTDTVNSTKKPGINVDTNLGVGPRIKIGIGYKL